MVLVSATAAVGLYFKHYFVVAVFGVWLCVECSLWFLSPLGRWSAARRRQSISRLSSLLSLLSRSDPASESLLRDRIREARFRGNLTDAERQWLERLKNLIELRGLALGQRATGRTALRQAFVFVKEVPEAVVNSSDTGVSKSSLSLQDISDQATAVAELYWCLYEAALGEFQDLAALAKDLYSTMFGIEFEEEQSRTVIEKVTDLIQRDHGVPFLVLNLIRQGRFKTARHVTRMLLTGQMSLDEEVRSSLYWVSEIYWFTEKRQEPLSDFESTIRYLYHLCFTNPERAGFLEIDSQFFSQFEHVNELAREGFLFKESLIDQLLQLWRSYDGYFDNLFTLLLQTMTGERSKIYENVESWERFWQRERVEFGKDCLYVVEGNLSYATGQIEDARLFYEKALEINPGMRAAIFNVLFCYAKLGDWNRHETHVNEILGQRGLLPSALYVIGDSFLIGGKPEASDAYYEELKRFDHWGRKGDYYRSTFCYENGLYEQALQYARKAHDANPNDSSVSYHLSLCYRALGEKESALDVIKRVRDSLISPSEAQWLKYYQFTLERDAGRTEEASETLRRIPTEYFKDPEELEEAIEFARGTKDLALLRHLKVR